ncbi:unnamed protein product, partial [Mesorhabditis belari]|uniref:Uncharacterized protein n=1 Tax=Mesorhabditis belari TaxID=2138241 RepID=A0AAF3F2Y9_9BILA
MGMVSDTSDCLYYTIYRDSNCTNEAVCKEVIEEIKDHVWEAEGITLKTNDGYSGFYSQHGTSKILQTPMDLWKAIHVLFRLSEKFEGLVFSVSTDDDKRNPFYIECDRNEVIPKWANIPGQFTKNVYGCGGVLHCISPDVVKANPKMKGVEIVRKFGRQTRNILITEAVQQKINIAKQKRFGMNRVGVSVPDNLAYIARQRPDLLSQAIRRFADDERDESLEALLDQLEKVMVHVEVSDRDYKVVTALADIDAPTDIVSHRIGLFLLELDRKFSNCQNGADVPEDTLYRNVEDQFERDRLSSLAMKLMGKELSLAHQYQTAKAFVTDAHRQICRNIFRESAESSTDTRDTACSGDDEDQLPVDRNKNRKQVYKKKKDRAEVGKKRTLAPVQLKKLLPDPPKEYEYEMETPAASSQFRNFERAANGDDAFYKESSDERSLGEEEELEFFAARSKIGKKNGEIEEKALTPRPLQPLKAQTESDDGFDVSDLLNAAPPLAANDEDFDDI